MRALWTPYVWFSRRSIVVLIGVQVAVTLGIWLSLRATWLPSPVGIIEAWRQLIVNQGLLPNLLESIRTSLISLVAAGLLSTLIVFLSTAPLFWPFAKFMAALRFLGFAGLTYIFTLLTKNGDDLKVGLLTFGMNRIHDHQLDGRGEGHPAIQHRPLPHPGHARLAHFL